MRKIIVLLYFLVATVTGEMQVQNPGQGQLVQSNVQSPVEALAFRIAQSGPPRRKPCQGRIKALDGTTLVDGSVPTLHSSRVYPIEHKITRDANNYEPNKPESLTERDFESLLLTENEQKPKQDHQRANVNDDYNLCQDDEDSQPTRVLKPSPDEVQKQAIKLIKKCAQDSKNSGPENESPSRRSYIDSAPQIEMGGSSGFNVPVYDDFADVSRRDALQNNNDYDASLPNMGFLRTNPAAVSENHGLASQSNLSSHKGDEILYELQHPVLTNFAPNVINPHPANARVCYACSSLHDPTCLKPDQSTKVKYCLRDDKCLTKTIETPRQPIVIRDCGSTCAANKVPGVLPGSKSCFVCDSDLCNNGKNSKSAAAIDKLNILLATFIMAAFKYAL